MVNLQIEVREGQVIREENKSGPGHARQARQQFKDTAELILALEKELAE